ncbi:unnamed protein product [Vitrella brassicaformis CCMP3155]|uniref:RING-type domain-containing protein n=2 Tax=Vitrella brassicaformis TaxID=1169539 RepID=A0A0G4G6P9_VITBC|nr:unnamed protein product [Vitrella brassicaformis CCMP3155]|eukprot:CEM24043.1 unnamed protein product [Vitrella brassicaformis CCMP3155]
MERRYFETLVRALGRVTAERDEYARRLSEGPPLSTLETCPVCCDCPVQVVLSCGHLYCRLCAARLVNNRCHECRQRVSHLINIAGRDQSTRQEVNSRQHDRSQDARSEEDTRARVTTGGEQAGRLKAS